jgi:hypothetical protein
MFKLTTRKVSSDVDGLFRADDGRYFIERECLAKRAGGKIETIRRVYLYKGVCEKCNKTYFSSKKNARFCSIACSHKGEFNPQWKGGRFMSGKYMIVTVDGRRVPEHRLVMEKHLNRMLKDYELVHHKNAIKTDNRLENLEILICYPKGGLHKGVIECPYCSKEFTIR